MASGPDKGRDKDLWFKGNTLSLSRFKSGYSAESLAYSLLYDPVHAYCHPRSQPIDFSIAWVTVSPRIQSRLHPGATYVHSIALQARPTHHERCAKVPIRFHEIKAHPPIEGCSAYGSFHKIECIECPSVPICIPVSISFRKDWKYTAYQFADFLHRDGSQVMGSDIGCS